MVLNEQHGTFTVSGGSGFATIVVNNGIMNQVIIRPTNGATTFDANITNSKGFIIFDIAGFTGTFNEYTDLALRDNATLFITTSNPDGNFDYYISIKEE